MAAITFKGRVTLGGEALRCPGRAWRDDPSRLTLIATPGGVRATCGRKHAVNGGPKAECWWPVTGLQPGDVEAVAAARLGHIRATLEGGATLEGKLTEADASAGKPAGKAGAAGKPGKLPQKKAGVKVATKGKPGRAVAALAAKAGPKAARGGGSVVAALGAVTAIAQAAGQVAQATGSAVGATAGVATRAIDAGRDVTRTVDNMHGRRWAARQAAANPAPKETP